MFLCPFRFSCEVYISVKPAWIGMIERHKVAVIHKSSGHGIEPDRGLRLISKMLWKLGMMANLRLGILSYIRSGRIHSKQDTLPREAGRFWRTSLRMSTLGCGMLMTMGCKRRLLFSITSSLMEWTRTAMRRKMCVTRSCGICICRSCFVEPEAHYSANARMIVCKVSTMAGDHAPFLQRNMLHLTKQSA